MNKDHVETILNKLEDNQVVDNILELLESLTLNSRRSKFLNDNSIQTMILGKLKNDQSIDEIIKLKNKLRDSYKQFNLDKDGNIMEAIFSKLPEKQNLDDDDILKLIKELTERGITLNSNSANVLYNSLDESAKTEFAKIKLAIALKKNDIELKLPEGCFWDKSLDDSEFL